MKRCRLFAVVLLLAGAANVLADGVRPGFPRPGPQQPVFPPAQPQFPQPQPQFPQPQPQLPPVNPVLVGSRTAELVVEIDPLVKTAKLQIPSALLQGNARGRFGADAGRIPTLIAGLALTCAFVSGGFWLMRKGRGRTLIAVLMVLSLMVSTATISADIAVGPRPKKEVLTPVILPASIQLSGKVVLEVIPFGTKVRLVVNKEMVAKGEKAEKAEKP